MPDFRQLQRFIAVAEERNFRRAAALLHVSQPPLSESIRKLEEELGTPLFERTRRRVALTKAGEIFLSRARLLLAQLDETVAMTQAVAKGQSGQLTIGFFPTATYDLLPRILRQYRERYPQVGLRFAELRTPEQPDALLQKRIDIGLFLVPTLAKQGIAQETVTRERLFVALPQDHPLAQRKSVGLRALRHEPFIFIPSRRGTGLHARVYAACQQEGFTPNVIEEVEHLYTMISLVAAGMGVTVVAESLQRFQPPGVVFRKLTDKSDLLYLEFGLAWREDDGSAAVTGFRDIARQMSPP
ncbi:MAG: LysR substrate-binding domain-containing protein [Alphaproteobacteria bacterium]|nr:LysR substrate-binding domain-containing protein [Alphaproteobacteria bacterium]